MERHAVRRGHAGHDSAGGITDALPAPKPPAAATKLGTAQWMTGLATLCWVSQALNNPEGAFSGPLASVGAAFAGTVAATVPVIALELWAPASWRTSAA